MAPPPARALPLSRALIVEAALRVAERDGIDRLTMRALATELGVSPMSIYHHIADKRALLELVVQEVHQRQIPLRLGDDGWEASLRRHLASLWEEQTRYPGLSAHLLAEPMLGTTPTTIANGVAFFEAAGFPPRTAQLAWSFALTYIHGRLSVEARLLGSDGAVRMRGLRAPDYVEFGLDAVVAGLRALRRQTLEHA